MSRRRKATKPKEGWETVKPTNEGTKNVEKREPDEAVKAVKEGESRKKKKKNLGHVHEGVGQNKALRYLKQWEKSQASKDGDCGIWKFEKCRQIWLLQNTYDEKKIPDEHFDSLLKYISSIKGRMRQMALDMARKKLAGEEDKIKLVEEEGKTEAEALLAMDDSAAIPTEKVIQRASEIVEML